MTTTPILGMTEWAAAQASPWIAHNLALRYLEFFAAGGAIEDRDETDPSGLTPSDGEAWLIADSAAGDWAGKDGQLALYVNTGFVYLTAKEGMQLYLKDEDVRIIFDGSAWESPAGSAGALTTSDLDTDGTLAANSDSKIATQKATKTYVDTAVAGVGGLPAATASDVNTGTSTTKAVTPGALADSAAPQTLTDGATINWDMANGYNAKVTLGGNRTLATPTNPKQGLTYSLAVIQDATGSRTMTWPSAFDWGSAGAPTLTTTASKRDRITLFCTDAATPKFDAFLSGKGFS